MKIMKDTWMAQKIIGLVTRMLPYILLPVIKAFRFLAKLYNKTEQLLLDI